MKRPPTVWVTQILLAVFVLVSLVKLVLVVGFAISWTAQRHDSSILLFDLFILALPTALLVLFAISFWGMLKAKTYGRWLGITSLAFVWAVIIYAQLSRPSRGTRYYDYDYSAQGPGIVVAQSVLHVTFLVLITRLAFARKVAEFFQ